MGARRRTMRASRPPTASSRDWASASGTCRRSATSTVIARSRNGTPSRSASCGPSSLPPAPYDDERVTRVIATPVCPLGPADAQLVPAPEALEVAADDLLDAGERLGVLGAGAHLEHARLAGVELAAAAGELDGAVLVVEGDLNLVAEVLAELLHVRRRLLCGDAGVADRHASEAGSVRQGHLTHRLRRTVRRRVALFPAASLTVTVTTSVRRRAFASARRALGVNRRERIGRPRFTLSV